MKGRYEVFETRIRATRDRTYHGVRRGDGGKSSAKRGAAETYVKRCGIFNRELFRCAALPSGFIAKQVHCPRNGRWLALVQGTRSSGCGPRVQRRGATHT